MSFHAVLAAISKHAPGFARIMDRHMEEVVRGASVAFVLKVVGAVSGFLFNLLLARLLGAQGAGIYFLALTVTTVAAMVGRLGLDNALIRFTAARGEQKAWGSVRALYRKGVGLSAGLSVIAAITVFLFAKQLAELIFGEPLLVMPLRIMSLAVVPLSLSTLHGSLLIGLKRVREAIFVQGVGVPLLGIPLLILLGTSFGVSGAVTGYLGATTVVFILSVLFWRHAFPTNKAHGGSFSTRLLISTSLPLFWVVFLSFVLSSSSTVILGIWADSEAVGVFGIALRTTLLMRFVLDSVNSVVAPKFATLYEKNDLAALGKLTQNATLLMTIVSLPVLLVIILFPQAILGFFGAEFATGAAVLVILAVGQFINVATGSVGYLLIMSGHEKIFRNNVIFNAIINIILNVILIWNYSVVGAAVATTLSLALQNVITLVLVRKYLSINVWSLAIVKGG